MLLVVVCFCVSFACLLCLNWVVWLGFSLLFKDAFDVLLLVCVVWIGCGCICYLLFVRVVCGFCFGLRFSVGDCVVDCLLWLLLLV